MTNPVQTFYFDPMTFSDINILIATLSALENAFIGAYLNAIGEFASLVSRSGERVFPMVLSEGRSVPTNWSGWLKSQLPSWALMRASGSWSRYS